MACKCSSPVLEFPDGMFRAILSVPRVGSHPGGMAIVRMRDSRTALYDLERLCVTLRAGTRVCVWEHSGCFQEQCAAFVYIKRKGRL